MDSDDKRDGADGGRDNQPLRLLLVDDEAEFLRATERALNRRGFVVTCAAEGMTALLLCDSQVFDVAVLDVKMPGIDGVDVFRRLKRSQPQLPVILLTGHGGVQQAFQTSREGVYEYLTKPCDLERLAAVAREAAASVSTRQADADTDEVASPGAVRLLLVDSEVELLDTLAPALERRGLQVTCGRDANAALAACARQAFDVALIDAKLPGMDGLTLLRRLKAAQPLLEVLLLASQPSMDLGVEAIKEGAFDCLNKPQSPDLLAAKIREAFHVRERRIRDQREAQLAELISSRKD